MATSLKAQLTSKIDGLKAGLSHAFAVEPEGQPLSSEDLVLLEKVATEIVSRHMADPGVIFLESAGPMNFLGSQALHFLTPILDLACNAKEIERAAHLLERRDSIPRLIALIESKAESGKIEPR
ncbi:MAG: hypothetical protein FJ246_03800 [Nitrospira sp.]|nr:hypothetical protein [Nitrospira sp.]